jgi:hypothetical protein
VVPLILQHQAATSTCLLLLITNLAIGGNGDKYLQGNTTITNSLTFTGSNLKTVNAGDILTLNGTISGETSSHSFIGKLVKTQPISGVVTNNFGNIGIGFTNTGGGNWGAVTSNPRNW